MTTIDVTKFVDRKCDYLLKDIPRYLRIAAAVDKQRLCDAYLRNEDYIVLAKHLAIKRTTTLAII